MTEKSWNVLIVEDVKKYLSYFTVQERDPFHIEERHSDMKVLHQKAHTVHTHVLVDHIRGHRGRGQDLVLALTKEISECHGQEAGVDHWLHDDYLENRNSWYHQDIMQFLFLLTKVLLALKKACFKHTHHYYHH